ncbi:hypothetical protein LINGRAHAP2_LOCUS35976 [Linum grandiflorum]
MTMHFLLLPVVLDHQYVLIAKRRWLHGESLPGFALRLTLVNLLFRRWEWTENGSK